MKNFNLLLILISLLIGGSIGYLIKDNNYKKEMPSYMSENMHVMPDGSMMQNNHDKMNMSDMMDDMNSNLRGKKGDDLDQAFIDEMIIHHEGAIEMSKIIVENSNRDELVQLGNDIISSQQSEIDLMKKWRKDWFKE